MRKVIIQCNSFMKVDDFNRLKENMIEEFKEKGCVSASSIL